MILSLLARSKYSLTSTKDLLNKVKRETNVPDNFFSMLRLNLITSPKKVIKITLQRMHENENYKKQKLYN